MAALSRTLAPRVGRYRVLGRISSGGMGVVHLGVYLGDGGFARKVAIKFLHPHLATIAELVDRFLEEAKLAARIVHPNVVATIDVVQDGETLCLVMDYVRGVSVSALVGRSTAGGAGVPPPIATRIAVDALRGLFAAHTATGDDGTPLDVVHRDVSPQNILVGLDGVSRIVDFGIAKAAGSLQTTGEGQLKGKLRYMAPEQIVNQLATSRSDVYSAAVVLWEMLAARKLFDAANDGALLAKVLEGAVLPPSHFAKAVSSELDAIVLKGLDRDPESRFTSAEEMALALERLDVGSSADVGAWAESLAGTEVREREATLAAEVEAEASETGDRTATGHSLLHVEHTVPMASQRSGTPAKGTGRRRALVAALGFFVVAGVATAFAALRRPSVAASPAPIEEPASPSPSRAVASAAPPPPPPVDRSEPPVATATAPAATARRPAPARASKPDCRTPYYFDPSGIRRVKRECL